MTTNETRIQYQAHEIEALLGDHANDYDIEALVDEITEVDYRTGTRYYKWDYFELTDTGLEELLERHKASLAWERDPGYSFEETARRGDFAAVIVPPEYTDDGFWGYQIFDEADEEAMDDGLRTAEAYQIGSRDAAKRLAGILLEELDAARA